GPEHRTDRAARQQRDQGAAALNGVHGAGRGANELIVHITHTLPDDVDQLLEAGTHSDVGERVADHPARHFALAVPAETIGDTPDADVGALDERVLVDLAHGALVAGRRRSETRR